jgi:hypothetical protein
VEVKDLFQISIMQVGRFDNLQRIASRLLSKTIEKFEKFYIVDVRLRI